MVSRIGENDAALPASRELDAQRGCNLVDCDRRRHPPFRDRGLDARTLCFERGSGFEAAAAPPLAARPHPPHPPLPAPRRGPPPLCHRRSADGTPCPTTRPAG